ncbi:MAG: GNAT family N-acetyltransferase [Sediminibacterium sp.]
MTRQPTTSDAGAIIDYSKTIFASTDQLLNTLDEYTITLENEKTWITTLNENPNAFLLIAESDGAIIGFVFFIPNSKVKNAHTGECGVNVHPAFQGQGIGRQLMQELLDWAKENQQIQKIVLQVFATNKHAIALYKNLGFIEEGRHIKAVKQISGEYVDVLQMFVFFEKGSPEYNSNEDNFPNEANQDGSPDGHSPVNDAKNLAADNSISY